MPYLVLASASLRRMDLLSQMGVTPDEVISADINETPLDKELPRNLALRLALGKAKTVQGRLARPEAGEQAKMISPYILAADTVVACGRRILDKTEDETQARRCLHLLSGRRHRVYGGMALICPDGREVTRVVQSHVQFKRLSPQEIDFYICSEEWRGKAGGYAIQGIAAAFIKHISGSYSNVVGLSVYDTARMLTGNGYVWTNSNDGL